MNRQEAVWIVAFVVMATASVFLIFSDDPENTAVISEDSRVTITGVARASTPFTIASTSVLSGSIFGGSAYHVEPSGAVQDRPLVLSFALNDLPFAASEAVVYRYSKDDLMWELVNPIVAHTDDVLAVEVNELGTFTVGVREDVTAPNFMAVYEELRDNRPEGAVGYVVTAGYARAGEPIARLSMIGEQGGCGGVVLPGIREERSVMTRDIVLLVDDVETPVVMTFLARWFVRDGDACAPGLPFHPSDEYGMLPSS